MTATASRLCFDAATHTYTLNGKILPSVTRILEDVKIINYDHIPWHTRQMALERGSQVHLATQLDDELDLDESSLDGDYELPGYLEGWRAFRRAMDIERFDHIEKRMHDPLGFAGTMDRYIDGIVLDIKTNEAPWWVRIQLAAYAHMAGKENLTVARRMAVELHRDGTFKLFEFPIADQRKDFQTFCAALRVYQEKDSHRKGGV
jgi:hypothetical protein